MSSSLYNLDLILSANSVDRSRYAKTKLEYDIYRHIMKPKGMPPLGSAATNRDQFVTEIAASDSKEDFGL